ncbi:SulP family inorganic anion transporter, partial [Aquamicrobium sp.]|uniref:SulP family inorganic anion transporter n=1 Tax=Aquamicrobium sp. TaxID=1872579 RepID=UPI002582BE38
MIKASRYFPFLQWAKTYDGTTLTSDLLAAVIVTIMLIPQSLAYAMLAGLPAEAGLYASILPLVAYAIFGTSRTLAVGPVAVVSLMTASAIGQIAAEGTLDYLTAAVVLALLSGGMLVAMGIFRLGFLANFLSHPVISGFITASGLLIAAGQLRHILGVSGGGSTLPEILFSLSGQLFAINPVTLVIGIGVLAFLYFARKYLKPLLVAIRIPGRLADMMAKAAPILAVAVTVALAASLDLGAQGVALVGEIPQGLPAFGVPAFSLDLVSTLFVPAFLISVVGFVESVSV